MSDYSCGTGGWNGPKPGDPSNFTGLRARPVHGGIEVSWNFPSYNPYAVAHTKVFRSESSGWNTAMEIATVSGNIFLDRIYTDQTITYYYWIQQVSMHGTLGEVIGPVSATYNSYIDDIIRDLTDKIDKGALARALREEIDRILDLDNKLADEILARIHANETLSMVLSQVQTEVGESATLVLNEVIERKSADEAFVQSINAIAAGLDSNTAAIIEERTVRVTELESVAQQITILHAAHGENLAAILEERQARANALEAVATSIDALVVTTGENTAAIQQEALARTTALDAMATAIDTLEATFSDEIGAAIQQERLAWSSATEALASDISTAEAELLGNIAQVETGLTSSINTVDGKVTQIGAQYTAKVNVNGLIGGFGVYNDGTEVEAGFDVDTFWIGRSSSNKKKPFIVTGSTVYMDDAMVHKLTFDKLVDSSGLAVVQNGKIKASYLQADQIVIGRTQVTGLGTLAAQNNVSTGQVTGLGSLATQNNVSVSQVTGLGSLATKSGLSIDEISGTGALAKLSTVTTSHVTGLGTFATLNKINANNIDAYIGLAAIGGAYIGSAAIGSAHIGDLQVDTIKIKEGALSGAITYNVGASQNGYFVLTNNDVSYSFLILGFATASTNSPLSRAYLGFATKITQATFPLISWTENTQTYGGTATLIIQEEVETGVRHLNYETGPGITMRVAVFWFKR